MPLFYTQFSLVSKQKYQLVKVVFWGTTEMFRFFNFFISTLEVLKITVFLCRPLTQQFFEYSRNFECMKRWFHTEITF